MSIENKNVMVFTPFEPGTVRQTGPLGKALDLTVRNRLNKVCYRHLSDPFRQRREADFLWRSEFWGKIVRSAVSASTDTDDAELRENVHSAVDDILAAQTEDGCVSSYPAALQLKGWDIWGRKYVLLGLLRYYDEIERDPRIPEACGRLLDHLIGQIRASGKALKEYGEHDGLATSSILGAVVKTWRVTGKAEHLAFAREIVESGCSKKHSVYRAAQAGVPPAETGNGKAYELMSCFEGLAEYYTVEPKAEYLEILEKFWDMVHDQEIFVTGLGGLKDAGGEYFFYGAMRQTRSDSGKHGETCVGVTWVRFCFKMLQLTGRADIADALERSLYNAIHGAMSPDGTRWTHANPTPLSEPCEKRAADDQINGFGEDCCLAQGPEAVALAPRFALMRAGNGIALNSYENLRANLVLPEAGKVQLTISGGYPYEGTLRIGICSEHCVKFPVRLRIPPWWSRTARIYAGGEEYTPEPGTWLVLDRAWQPDEEIRMEFHLCLRAVESPDLSRTAFLRGPLVMARDERLSCVDEPLPAELQERVLGESEKPEETAFVVELADGSKLCDYASAGNLFARDDRLTVWLRRKASAEKRGK